jgi:hypothetical protein
MLRSLFPSLMDSLTQSARSLSVEIFHFSEIAEQPASAFEQLAPAFESSFGDSSQAT